MLFRFSNNDASIAFSGPSIGTCRYSWDATSSSVGFQPVINLRIHDTKGNITSKPSSLNPTDTSSLAWDFDNRLDAIDVDGDTSVDVTFEYDALGRRVRKNDIVYVLSGQQVIAEYAAGTTATTPTEKYVYASYIDEPVLKDGTGGLQYYHRNQQYSVIVLTGPTGAITERYAYDAYGNLTVLDASGPPSPSPIQTSTTVTRTPAEDSTPKPAITTTEPDTTIRVLVDLIRETQSGISMAAVFIKITSN